MADSSQGNGMAKSSPAFGIFVFSIIFFVGGYFLFHRQIVSLFLKVGAWLIYPINLVFSDIFPKTILISQWIEVAKKVPEQVDFNGLVHLSNEMGWFYRWPLLLLTGWAVFKALRHPMLLLSTTHTAETLLKTQSKVWKSIVPMLNNNLINNHSPEWAPSRSAATVAKESNLIYAGKLKLHESFELFKKQLGRKKNTVLRPYEKALFAVFALRIIRDRTSAHQLLDQINESCRANGNPDFKVAEKVYAKISQDKRVLAEINGFFYVSTVMIQMLVMARRSDGKLPTSDFIWLKPIDRSLWYALDRSPVNYDRLQVASFTEGAGIISQWQAESVAKNAGYHMFVTKKVSTPDGQEIEVRIAHPFLVTAMVAFVCELDDTGIINQASDVIQKRYKGRSVNERARFDTVRDLIVVPALKEIYEKMEKTIVATAQARYLRDKKVEVISVDSPNPIETP